MKRRKWKARASRIFREMGIEFRQMRGKHDWATLLAAWEREHGRKWEGMQIGTISDVRFFTASNELEFFAQDGLAERNEP
jgi:hypothetical protein